MAGEAKRKPDSARQWAGEGASGLWLHQGASVRDMGIESPSRIIVKDPGILIRLILLPPSGVELHALGENRVGMVEDPKTTGDPVGYPSLNVEVRKGQHQRLGKEWKLYASNRCDGDRGVWPSPVRA